ncbi:permease [Gulosibacter sediminis]|uniref:permease n=1 Tax=Gulosibacter sediminis TaxID=1729695 RepID=UPI0024A8B78A|nr:permease [Gulosibacter sediminis]
MSASAALLLIRPRGSSATLTWLQMLASGVSTLLAFGVTILAIAFWNAPTDEPGYIVLSVALVGLLIVPLITLGSATARLAARSRDDRLATLRLLGATSARVRRIAVAEVTVIATFGALIGTALSVVLPFLLSLLTVYGRALDSSELWLPWWLSASLPPLMVAVAAVSGMLGLRQVVLSPLGVRTRQDAPRLSWLRLVAALAVLGIAVLVMQSASDAWGTVVVIIVLSVAVLAVMAVLGLVGPLIVSRLAGRRDRRTSDAARLIAARGIVDDPRTAWREVSALALATFVLIPSGSMLGYLNTIQNSASREIMTTDQLLMFADARTMVIALVAVSFLVVAWQIAITQTAAVIERRELYVALDRIGMPRRELNRARQLRVTMPANIAVLGSALAAATIAFWVVLMALITSPVFIIAIAVVLAAGLLLIRFGVASTNPVLDRVLTAPTRGE